MLDDGPPMEGNDLPRFAQGPRCIGDEQVCCKANGAKCAGVAAYLKQRLDQEHRELLRHLEDRHYKLVNELIASEAEALAVKESVALASNGCSSSTGGQSNSSHVANHYDSYQSGIPSRDFRQDRVPSRDSLRQPQSTQRCALMGPDDPQRSSSDGSPGSTKSEDHKGSNGARSPVVVESSTESTKADHGSCEEGCEDENVNDYHNSTSLLSAEDHSKQEVVDWRDTTQGFLFEVFFALLILANACVMALHSQYEGLQHGYDLSIRTYDAPKKAVWPGGEATFMVFEKAFTILFTIEFVVRLIILRVKFLRDFWCYMDLFIITIAWILLIKEDLIQINVTFMRLARISKMLRILRVLRSQEVFDSLKLLVAAIRASVNTLFWSLMILFLIQCVAGLFMVQTMESFLADESNDPEIKREVFVYFGTFWRAMITMFEVTFANWVPSCRLLLDHVHELYGAFYLVYRCVIGFCVLMVVQAVFLEQTMKTRQLDDKFLAKQQASKRQKYLNRLQSMFHRLDKDGDGQLTWHEFLYTVQQGEGEIRNMLGVLELEVSDFHNLFRLLDDGDGVISIKEFVNSVLVLKGPAREIDLMEVRQVVKDIQAKIAVLETYTRLLQEHASSADKVAL